MHQVFGKHTLLATYSVRPSLLSGVFAT